MEMTDPDNPLKAYNISKDEFLAHAKEVMAQTMNEFQKDGLLSEEYSEKTQAETLYAKILSDDNVAKATPYIGEEGKLIIKCTLGNIWGMEAYTAFPEYDTELAGDAKTYTDADYGTVTYVLPKVICPKGAEDVINNTLIAVAHERLDPSLARVDYPNVDPFQYYWGVKDNVLTVVFESLTTDALLW